MYSRFTEHRVREALTDTPAVLIVGPRRAGKTTLARKMGTSSLRYITLDDQTTLNAALADPVGFIRGIDRAIIDEVQRAPELLLAIKKAIDEDYRPGRFLLTGSANVLTLPKVADSLAGRIETIGMLPLARAEILGRPPTFLDRLFNGKLQSQSDAVLGDDLVRLVLRGGFPEVLSRAAESRQQDWAHAYMASVLTRDLREIAQIDKFDALPKFVRLLAEYSAQTVNYSQIGAGVDINNKTSQRYISLLEQIYLVETLPSWHTNMLKRLGKAPKLHFLDTGLLSTSRGMTFDRVRGNRVDFGPLLETFVFSEIMKIRSGSALRVHPHHFRTLSGQEVDIVLERDDGIVAGIEIKASATVKATDFQGLKILAETCKDKFALGVVLYDGEELISFADNLVAAPLSCLWGL